MHAGGNLQTNLLEKEVRDSGQGNTTKFQKIAASILKMMLIKRPDVEGISGHFQSMVPTSRQIQREQPEPDFDDFTSPERVTSCSAMQMVSGLGSESSGVYRQRF